MLFCERFNKPVFPLKKETLSAYACFLSENLKSHGSVQNYLSGIKTWANILNYDIEAFSSPGFKLTVNGLSKLNLSVPNKRMPFQPNHLLSFYRCLNLNEVKDCVVWSLLLVAFFGMLRKSQFANSSRKQFNVNEQLTRGDISFTSLGMVISIKWSKTNQKHDRIHEIPLARIPSVLCPVDAYAHMVSLLPALPHEPAFGLPSSSGKISPFSKADIDKILRSLVVQCGLSPFNYSFHGLRRGGATVASVSGCSDSEICLMGGWASSCYKGYICPPLESLYRVSKSIGEFCQSCIGDD